jgi:hypothetical protein
LHNNPVTLLIIVMQIVVAAAAGALLTVREIKSVLGTVQGENVNVRRSPGPNKTGECCSKELFRQQTRSRLFFPRRGKSKTKQKIS